MYLSVIIPVWNEEKNIRPLYDKLSTVLKSLRKKYEIIFIDDGSADGTNSELKGLSKKDKKLTVIRLRKNFGKSIALKEGFEKAKGKYVITMDGDLQDEPDEIPKFFKKIKDYDLVVGWKYNRLDPLTKKIPSKIFNKLTSWLTGVDVHDSNCCFKLFRKEVLKDLKLYGELHRYIPSLAKWKGYRVGEVKVKHNPRLHGKSKYGANRLLKGFLDLISIKFLMSYAKKPMHFFGSIGIFLFAAGLIINAYLGFIRIFFLEPIGDRPLLLLGILLMVTGIQFISIGLIGEMISGINKDYQANNYTNGR